MNPSNLQTPEEMLDRWHDRKCSCVPEAEKLCESCHDFRVVRDLLAERDAHRAAVRDQAARLVRDIMAESWSLDDAEEVGPCNGEEVDLKNPSQTKTVRFQDEP